MDNQVLLGILVVVAVCAATFAAGVAFYPKLKSEKQGYPMEAAVEAALLPIIYQGICAAYRLALQGVDELKVTMDGLDRKEVADSLYKLLPDQVAGFDISLVKRFVSQERFQQLVQDAFDRFDRMYGEHKSHFDELFEAWKRENTPGATQPTFFKQ
jgi:hypothetical protein